MNIKNILLILVLALNIFSLVEVKLAQTPQEIETEAQKLVNNLIDKNIEAAKKDLFQNYEIDDKAKEKFFNLFLFDPTNPKLITLLTQWYVSGQMWSGDELGTAAYLKEIEYYPNDPAPYYNFALFLHEKGVPEKAEKFYAKSLELRTTPSYNNHYWRGQAAFQSRNYSQCVESMSRAITLIPPSGDNRKAYMYLSLCQSMTGDKVAAATNLQKAISLGGTEISDHIYVKSKAFLNPVKCEKDYNKQHNKYFDANHKVPEKWFIAHFQFASCFPDDRSVNIAGRDLVKAFPELKSLYNYYNVRIDGFRNIDAINTTYQTDWFYKNQFKYIQQSLNKREFIKGLSQTAKYALITPNVPEIYYMRALLFLEIPEYKILAWREANHLMRLNKNSPAARAIRARVYYEVKKNAQLALAEINEGFKFVLPERAADLYFARGKVNYGEKKYAQAQADFQAALKVEPNYPFAAFYLSLASNPQQNENSATAELDQETKLLNDYNAIVQKVGIERSNHEWRVGRAKTQKEVCDSISILLKNLREEQAKLVALQSRVANSEKLKKTYQNARAALSENISNLISGSSSCSSNNDDDYR